MADFKPSFPYSTPVELLIPVYTQTATGTSKTYPAKGIRINCSFKTFGGTEANTKYAFSVLNTAQVETWFRPDIAEDCRIKLLPTGEVYEVVGKPENISMRNQFCKFRVRALGNEVTITLIMQTEALDSIRQAVMEESTRDISGIMLELQEEEYAHAQQYLMMPAFRFRVFVGEYNGEHFAQVSGKRYHIYRAQGVSDYIELYLGERIGDLSANA